MELEHHFSVPVPVDQAWEVLLDVERIAPCMPGATVDAFDGETVEGKVKVKVGPIQVTYAGTAKFTEKDETARRAVLEANAKEARGTGTAAATITAVLTDAGGSATDVTVTTDLAITGKPAQFGRGVMAEVGSKLLGKFADCLADELGAGATAAVPAAEPAKAGQGDALVGDPGSSGTGGSANAQPSGSEPQAVPAPAPTPLRRSNDDAIDLLDAAGMPLVKRLAPVAVGLLVLLVLWRLMRKR